MSHPNQCKQVYIKSVKTDTQWYSKLAFEDISRRSMAANFAVYGGIWSNFEVVSDFMVVLVTCKTEEDPTIENVDTRMFTSLYINSSAGQGQRACRWWYLP